LFLQSLEILCHPGRELAMDRDLTPFYTTSFKLNPNQSSRSHSSDITVPPVAYRLTGRRNPEISLLALAVKVLWNLMFCRNTTQKAVQLNGGPGPGFQAGIPKLVTSEI
jgi:hypothetical protein